MKKFLLISIGVLFIFSGCWLGGLRVPEEEGSNQGSITSELLAGGDNQTPVLLPPEISAEAAKICLGCRVIFEVMNFNLALASSLVKALESSGKPREGTTTLPINIALAAFLVNSEALAPTLCVCCKFDPEVYAGWIKQYRELLTAFGVTQVDCANKSAMFVKIKDKIKLQFPSLVTLYPLIVDRLIDRLIAASCDKEVDFCNIPKIEVPAVTGETTTILQEAVPLIKR